MRSNVSQISLHKLEVLCLVIELNSVTRAAERLGISQPVVSAHLRALTEKFDVTLFNRSGGRLVLTNEGERIFRWARDVVSRTREMEREMAQVFNGQAGQASVGASLTLGSYALPALVSEYRQSHPSGEISVLVLNPIGVTDALLNGECDFAFTILDPRLNAQGLEIERVAADELILVQSGALRPSKSLRSKREIEDLPFIIAQAGTPRHEIEEAALKQHGIHRKRIILEFGHGESIKQAVRVGPGYAFVFRSSVQDELRHGALSVVGTPGVELKIPVYMVRKLGKSLSIFQQDLMHNLRTGIAALLAKPATSPDEGMRDTPT